MDIFSTREVAALIWTLILTVWGLGNDNIVKNVKGILRAFWNVKFISVFDALAVYLMLVCYILSKIFSWGLGEIKSAVFWFIFVGSVGIFKNAMTDEITNPVKDWIVTNLRFVILIEFLISKYTFSILGELILLPVVSIVVMMMAIAETKKENKQVFNLLEWVLAIVGIMLAWFAIASFIDDKTASIPSSLLEFSLPILFSLFSIPFFYGLHVYSNYDQVFSRFPLLYEDKKFRKEIRRVSVFRFGLRLNRLRRWSKALRSEKPSSINEVHSSIDKVVRQETFELNPPIISELDGWSPYKAKEYLSKQGYKTGYYNEFSDGWHAHSSAKKAILEGFCQSHILYKVKGSEMAANILELSLNVNDETQLSEAYIAFANDIRHLAKMVISSDNFNNELEALIKHQEGSFSVSNTVFELNHELMEVPNLKIHDYHFRITRSLGLRNSSGDGSQEQVL